MAEENRRKKLGFPVVLKKMDDVVFKKGLSKMACERCGACCLTIGRTFWKNGDFERIPELQERANNGDYEDYGVPCEMFELRGEIGVCLIHERYGYEAKPTACKEYPNGELCHRKKGL